MTKHAGWVRTGAIIMLLVVWLTPTAARTGDADPQFGALISTLVTALVTMILVAWLAIELLMARPVGSPTPTVRRLARHLAAQAVASDATGFGDTMEVSLKAHLLHSSGVVVYAPERPSSPVHEQWWSELVARLAGDLIDLADAGDSHGDLTNILQAETVAGWLAAAQVRPECYPAGPMEPGAILAAAREHARSILTSHAAWVDAVAETLLTTGHLTGADVTRLAPIGPAA